MNFENWLRASTKELAAIINQQKTLWAEGVCLEVVDDLREWNEPDCCETELVYPCQGCGEIAELLCCPTEFEPSWHYCGRSVYCCP